MPKAKEIYPLSSELLINHANVHKRVVQRQNGSNHKIQPALTLLKPQNIQKQIATNCI